MNLYELRYELTRMNSRVELLFASLPVDEAAAKTTVTSDEQVALVAEMKSITSAMDALSHKLFNLQA